MGGQGTRPDGNWYAKLHDFAAVLSMLFSSFSVGVVGVDGSASDAEPARFYSVAYFTPFLRSFWQGT